MTKTCVKCGSTEFNKRGDDCLPCRRIYAKAYREANKEKVSEAKKRAYRAKKDQYVTKSNHYQQVNKETLYAWSKQYRIENKEKIAALNKAYYEANKSLIQPHKTCQASRCVEVSKATDNVNWLIFITSIVVAISGSDHLRYVRY